MLSEKKRFYIANICYANVCSAFASFCNPKYRGENFKWKDFEGMMQDKAEGLSLMYDFDIRNKADKEEAKILFKQYSKEISHMLMSRSGFNKE